MRNLLHVDRLEAFKQYLDKHEYMHREPTANYQVLQVAVIIKGHCHWLPIYKRAGERVRLTTDARLDYLVRRFIKEGKSEDGSEDSV